MPQIMDNAKETKVKLCQKKKVMKAISVLKSLNQKFVQEELKKQPLLDETSESLMYLQVMLKKIPSSKLLQMIKFHLPHSLITETSEICLITGDLDKHDHKAEIEPVVMHYKDLLKKRGVTVVNEVIPLRQLRTEYKTFESKRQLVSAYDVFLVEKKIAGVMPRVLGKFFFNQRKFPVQVNIKTSNIKSQIEKALSETKFSLTCRGNSYAFEVARSSMEDSKILENIMSAVKVLADKIPGKWDNVLGIYLKTARSKAIPIYISFGNPNEVTFKKLRKKEKAKFQELSTVSNAQVKVLRDGRIILQKKRVDDGEAVEDTDVKNVKDPNVIKVKDEKDPFSADTIIPGNSNDKKTISKHKKIKSSANVDTSDNEASIKKEKTIEQEEYQGDSIENFSNSPKSKKNIQKEFIGNEAGNDSDIKKTSSKRKSMQGSVSNHTTEINESKTPLKSRKSKILGNKGITESEKSITRIRRGVKRSVSNETDIVENINESKMPLKSQKIKILKNEGITVSEESTTKNTSAKRKSMKGFVSKSTGTERGVVEIVNQNEIPLKSKKCKIRENEGINEIILKPNKNKVIETDESLEDDNLKTPLRSKRNKGNQKALMESSTKSRRKSTGVKYEKNKEKLLQAKKDQTPNKQRQM